MLNIVDINTNAGSLDEVERLKEEFRTLLSGVSNGHVIIISNFPPFGNMVAPLDYLIIISVIKESGNYFRVKVNGELKYINNAVIQVKSVTNDDITCADGNVLRRDEGEFDYLETLKLMNYDFHDYCRHDEDIWPYSVYRVSSVKADPYYNFRLLLNYPLTAKYLMWAIAKQADDTKKGSRVNSFPQYSKYTMADENMVVFARNLIDETDKRTKYGILTKKKLDRIAKSINIIDQICDNIGESLSVITGKAGTGKTLALTRVIYRHSKDHKIVRFLTFNKLLVYDIKQTLRNFPGYSDLNLSAMTVHQFYYKQAKDLGITLLLAEDRVSELLAICGLRIENLRNAYLNYKSGSSAFKMDDFVGTLPAGNKSNADHQEYLLFAKFIKREGMLEFDELTEKYLLQKRRQLEDYIGHQVFLEDYYNVLEKIYTAVTNPGQFYADFDIRNRYDLLNILYRMDVEVEADKENIIPFEALERQVKRVQGSVKWSRLFLIDECQDFHVLEKEILFHLRGGANMVVASGGKEQLIRRNSLLDWTVSMGKKVPHIPFKLTDVSYRQKQNIVEFVNAFGLAFGLPVNLKSAGEQHGLGKVIIDIRPKTGFINTEIAAELKMNGELNGCSPYESVIFLIPSRNYTEKVVSGGMMIDDRDVVHQVQNSSGRRTANLKMLEDAGFYCWDGVTEEKSKLKVPFQTDTRILHYESCRGLEAWSCALMSLDEFFNYKCATEEAALHLADDLHWSETERRDKFGALWCLMALTRPIDTLYIYLTSSESTFSRKLLEIAAGKAGVVILK